MERPENSHVGALTGKVLGYDIDAGKPTGRYDSTGIFHKWYGKWYDRGQGEYVEQELYNNEESVPAICGAVFFCRKSALDTILLRGKEPVGAKTRTTRCITIASEFARRECVDNSEIWRRAISETSLEETI